MISNIYELTEKIGNGNFGDVWKCKHKYNSFEYAVKQDTSKSNLLLHEVKIIKLLGKHKNIPQIKWYGKIDEKLSMITELYDKTIDKMYPLIPEDFKNYAFQMLDVIEYIHSKGIIHRDIKPDNFMLRKNNNSIILIDYGLARPYMYENKHVPIEWNLEIIGSNNFCSINMHNGIRPSRRDDIESLCYVFISLNVKKLPWRNICISNRREKNKMYIRLKNDIIESLSNTNINIVISKILKIAKLYNYEDKPQYNLFRKMLEE